MLNQKYPKSYTQGRTGLIKDPFTPEFRYDSRGRLIMPLPGYSKMMLSVEPGSKKVTQGTESEVGTPQTDPGSFDSGYVYSKTAIRFGPKGGWVTQLSGGNYEFPLLYFNEVTNVKNFYVDKNGNVYLKGTIVAEAGGLIGGWTIGTSELYAGSGASRVGLRPGTYPFYAGNENPALAPARINQAGQAWFTSVETLQGVFQLPSANIQDSAIITAKINDAAVTFDKVNKWFAGKMGISFPSSPEDGEEFLRTDENRFYRYSASAIAWIPVDFHPDSARFADGAIVNAKILNLDAGKITTGYLAALRLDTTVAYISQSAMIAGAVIINAHIANLDATKITTGDIASARMQTNVLIALQATITNLSAIKADLGTVTAGKISLPSGGSFDIDEAGINRIRINVHGVVARNTKGFFMEGTIAGRYGALYAMSTDYIVIDCVAGFTGDPQFAVYRCTATGAQDGAALLTAEYGGGTRSRLTGYLIGTHLTSAGAYQQKGLRIYYHSVGAISVEKGGFYTSSLTYSIAGYADFPTATRLVLCMFESVDTARWGFRTWNLLTTGFQWGVSNEEVYEAGIYRSVNIHFLIMGI